MLSVALSIHFGALPIRLQPLHMCVPSLTSQTQPIYAGVGWVWLARLCVPAPPPSFSKYSGQLIPWPAANLYLGQRPTL